MTRSVPLNPAVAATLPPPIEAARRWLEETPPPPDLPLLNFSQAAPTAPPPARLRRFIADTAMNDPGAHLYGPVLGLRELRAELASEWSREYGGRVEADQICVTQGCNQAFAAAVSTLAAPGDAVAMPAPWYFNHKMWLDMNGIATVLLPTGSDLIPAPERAAEMIDGRVKAISLVSPNNPAGVEYPAEVTRGFFDLARNRGVALILDATYRDFDSRAAPPHDIFSIPDWDDTLIQLYSFSKAYRLTGHRVGALAASPSRLAEVEKWLDCVSICANQLGQRAALWAMRNLKDWVAEERTEILARRAAIESAFAGLDRWRLLGTGAYFAYAERDGGPPSEELARGLVAEAGVLMLPATWFAPTLAEGGDGSAERRMRIAFANADRDGIAELARRLAAFDGA